jgi:hypothetical protein
VRADRLWKDDHRRLSDGARPTRKFSHTAFVVDRVNLVDQTSAVLRTTALRTASSRPGTGASAPTSGAGLLAQTLEKRGYLEKADLLIVDEAHCVRSRPRSSSRTSRT